MSDDFEHEYTLLDFDRIVHQTALAIIFDFGDEEHHGIPIVHIDMDNFDPEEATQVPVKIWFAKNNGLI